MKTRFAIWFCVAVLCIVSTWIVVERVREVEESATKLQALDHFNSSLR